ncbi:MAG: TPM domain-containing protein [Acidobacteria bacterium]|nr:TPM domain-containing protein [Acidobacteriota bacterium]
MKKIGNWEHWLLTLIICLAVGNFARAERVEDIPNPKTRDNTWVTDLPGMLGPETVQQLNSLIGELERERTAEMAVVIIHSLDGRSIDEFALDLGRRWGIGKRDKNNGLLFLWAVNDRRVKVEVGYGLEGVLPDGKVGAILDHHVIPHFKAEEFDEGVLQGVQALAAVIKNEPVDLPPATVQSYDEERTPVGLILGLIGIVPVGIGSFIGYRKWRRYHRRTCPTCGTTMQRLSETEEDELLDEVKQVEEKLRSVDYDVWKCPDCSHHFTLRYPRWFSQYSKCPQCRNRTCSKTEEIIRGATTAHTGLAEVTEECAFCNYRRVYQRIIPRVSTSSSSSGGGSSGGGGGGSFGGGSFGGGGAGRGY